MCSTRGRRAHRYGARGSRSCDSTRGTLQYCSSGRSTRRGQVIFAMVVKLLDAPMVDVLLRIASPTERRHVVLDVACQNEKSPEVDLADGATRQCIPGAVAVHPSFFESGREEAKYYPNYERFEDGNLLAAPLLHAALAELGISQETLVVVCARGSYAAMCSCRVAWALSAAGVNKIFLLDGGFDAWLSHGGPLQSPPSQAIAVGDFDSDSASLRSTAEIADDKGQAIDSDNATALRSGHCATTLQAVQAAAGLPGAGTLVDIRQLGEWTGSCTDNYDFFSSRGHLPRAIHNGDWVELVDRVDGTIGGSLDAVRQRWVGLGLSPAQRKEAGVEGPLIFYCGTGWRSAIGWVVAQLLGWPALNYDDGIYGWSSRGLPLQIEAEAVQTFARESTSLAVPAASVITPELLCWLRWLSDGPCAGWGRWLATGASAAVDGAAVNAVPGKKKRRARKRPAKRNRPAKRKRLAKRKRHTNKTQPVVCPAPVLHGES